MKGCIKKSHGGYVALMATIVLGALLLLMTVEGSVLGWNARFNVLGTEAKEQSLSHARGCLEMAVGLYLTKTFPSEGFEIEYSQGKCDILPIEENTPNIGESTIRVRASVREVHTNLVGVIHTDTGSIENLIEVPNL